jgi:hypothetical protein
LSSHELDLDLAEYVSYQEAEDLPGFPTDSGITWQLLQRGLCELAGGGVTAHRCRSRAPALPQAQADSLLLMLCSASHRHTDASLRERVFADNQEAALAQHSWTRPPTPAAAVQPPETEQAQQQSDA